MIPPGFARHSNLSHPARSPRPAFSRMISDCAWCDYTQTWRQNQTDLCGLTPAKISSSPKRFLLMSRSNDPLEFVVSECLEGLGADASQCSKFREPMERFGCVVRVQDEDSVVTAHRPILTFDFDAGLFREFIEGVRAGG